MLPSVWFLFVAIAVASGLVDVVSYRIPNGFIVALTVLFFVVASLHWTEVPWLSHRAREVVLGVCLFYIGKWGGRCQTVGRARALGECVA